MPLKQNLEKQLNDTVLSVLMNDNTAFEYHFSSNLYGPSHISTEKKS